VEAVVAAQALLIACRLECCLASGFFKQEEAVLEEIILARLVEGEDPWQSELDVGGKDRFCPIDKEVRSLPSRLGGIGADGPEDRHEVV
jgi:hypothetical protein